MLIRKVRAHGFGPLVDEELEFADGMTVIFGENESAKSSWHAAIYAALCGRKRGRGRLTADEQHFADLHRPWDGSDWVVSAELSLDDGRRIEMWHDLDGRVDCHAIDLDLGRDCSAEIIFEGTPDASHWLGLDRKSFAATACIRQTEVLKVLEQASGLQDHLQRAAATAGADHTAAAALDRIDGYQTERVGTDRPNSGKPLRRAMDRLHNARQGLESARQRHTEYELRVVEARQLREAEEAADRQARLHEAAAAAAAAGVWRARATEALELDRRLGRPEPTKPTDLPAAAGQELLELAGLLDRSPAQVDPTIQTRVTTARQAVAAGERRTVRRAWLLAGSSMAALLGIALVLLGEGYIGVATLLVGVVTMMVGVVYPRTPGGVDARTELEAATVAEASARLAAESISAGRRRAVARCGELGVPADPMALRELAAALAVQSRDRDWHAKLEQARQQAGQQVVGLRRHADEAEAHAARASRGFESSDLGGVTRIDDEWIGLLRRQAQAATAAARSAQGSLAELAAHLPSVSEAEEELLGAELELARVRELDETLGLTRRFLEAAQERAHRDIAPALAETVRRWLPELTGGRYTDVIVDPQTLSVRVCGPTRRWREADRLSVGTAEQIYLLLRMALAGHLVRDDVTCPLLLDDVTVHADSHRVMQILELLLRASEDRQVILFTQQVQVLDWARARLFGPRHAVRELAPVTTI